MFSHKKAMEPHGFHHHSCTDHGSFGRQRMQEFDGIAELASILSSRASKAEKYSREGKFLEHTSITLRNFFRHLTNGSVEAIVHVFRII